MNKWNFYAGGEQAECGDIVECVESVKGLKIGKLYTVVNPNSTFGVSLDTDHPEADGWYRHRFKLISRLHQKNTSTRTPKMTQQHITRAIQAVFITGIIYFWARMHGVEKWLSNIDSETLFAGWSFARDGVDQKVRDSGTYFIGCMGRFLAEIVFGVICFFSCAWFRFKFPDWFKLHFSKD